MTFIDSGYLIALLNPRDEFHSRALAWSASIAERLIVTEYVIVETVNFFSKPINRPKAHAMVLVFETKRSLRLYPLLPSYSKQDCSCMGIGRTRNGH